MKRRPIIHPICEILGPSSIKALNAISFHFTAIDLDRTKDNWLRLYVTWTAADKESYRVKYSCTDGSGSGHGGGRESQEVYLEFPEVSAPYGPEEHAKKYCAHINLGIMIKTGCTLNPPRLGYVYRFKQNIKYGVLVWFSPSNWNSGERDKLLFRWSADTKKRFLT